MEDEDLTSDAPVHIHLHQRTARKTTTTVKGISPSADLPSILTRWRKRFCCRSTLHEDMDGSPIVELSGDQRSNVVDDLLEHNLAQEAQIYVHGI